jgi:hypothetical protein|tara:strand:- start:1164 stop:1337 length:174 start_codon:yes stop_codon:yes gene_type:complete
MVPLTESMLPNSILDMKEIHYSLDFSLKTPILGQVVVLKKSHSTVDIALGRTTIRGA